MSNFSASPIRGLVAFLWCASSSNRMLVWQNENFLGWHLRVASRRKLCLLIICSILPNKPSLSVAENPPQRAFTLCIWHESRHDPVLDSDQKRWGTMKKPQEEKQRRDPPPGQFYPHVKYLFWIYAKDKIPPVFPMCTCIIKKPHRPVADVFLVQSDWSSAYSAGF